MIAYLNLTTGLTSEYREVVAGVGAVIDLAGGTNRRYRMFVAGADCYFRVGAAIIVAADVVVAGATRSPLAPEEGWFEFTTSAERIALMTSAGTARVWLTELSS